MALYRLSASVISRATGRSAVASAAYRAGARIRDSRTGLVHDYRRKAVEYAEVFVPDGAPAWMRDRARLWNRVEEGEKRRDAQLTREVQLALPRELAPSERRKLVQEFVQETFTSEGMVADVSIHNPRATDGEAQPHAHILLTMRKIIGTSFGEKNRLWNREDLLIQWREHWATKTNYALERAGVLARVDHRSLAAQREEAIWKMSNAVTEAACRDEAARAATLSREVVPTMRASWYMEQRAQKAAEASKHVYMPITDRGRLVEGIKRQIVEGIARLREEVGKLLARCLLAFTKMAARDVVSMGEAETTGDHRQNRANEMTGRDGVLKGPEGQMRSAADRLRAAETIARQARGNDSQEQRSDRGMRDDYGR